MRNFALLYLAVSACVALAIPAPLPVPQDDLTDLQDAASVPDVGPVGSAVGDYPPEKVPSNDEVIAEAVKESQVKRDLQKRALAGWQLIYADLNAATEHSSYKTYKTLPATTPDFAQACANFCDSLTGCSFFNYYKETFGPGPDDSKVKCATFSLPSGPAQATNDGQWRNGFRVTISHSYAYSKIVTPSVVGWTVEPLEGAIIGKRANPTDPDPYMGLATIEAADPSLCVAVCEEKTAYNSRHPSSNGSYRSCNFFNYYYLKKNGVAYKTVCSFYLISFGPEFATNHGYTSAGDVFTIDNSYGFTRNALQGVGGIVTPVSPAPRA